MSAQPFDNYRVERRDRSDRYISGARPESDVDERQHELDNEQGRALFGRIWTWWVETRDLHYASRQMRLRDHEFYDGRHWTPTEQATLEGRGQEALVFNLCKLMVDWVTGTERRTRIDWAVLPRTPEDVDLAPLKKQLLKYVSDVNKTGWQRSFAFKDAAVSGVGWLEDCVVSAANEEPCTSRYQDWKGVWWDAYSRDPLMRDCRFMFRRKWLDLDYACEMWPDRQEVLKRTACTLLEPGVELLEDDSLMPAMFAGTRDILTKSIAVATGRARQRVAVWECWYLDPKRKKTFDSVFGSEDPYHGKDYIEADARHAKLKESGLYTITEGVTDQMRLAFFCEGGLLSVKDSPYKHNRFPFTPVWAYRDHLDGMPYGVIRQVIDPQRDYNKRRSKALFLLSTNQVIYEDGAIDEDNEDAFFEEKDRPDGRMRVRAGALKNKRIEFRSNSELAAGQVTLMEEDRENILETSGVTRENTGQTSNAVSGKAILAKQQQGAVSTAELFDLLRLAVQESGEKLLSNVEKFMTLPKKFRVLGPDGAAQWIALNQPTFDPATGEVIFENDITANSADFMVDQQDYRETVRMAQAETLFELIGNIAQAAPQLAMTMLPMALDLTDIPNKQEMVAAARQAAGLPPAGKESDPATLAKEQAAQDAANEQNRIANESAAAQTKLTNAKADEASARAGNLRLDARAKSLDIAGLVAAAAPIAPAADRLHDGNMAPPQQPTQGVVPPSDQGVIP